MSPTVKFKRKSAVDVERRPARQWVAYILANKVSPPTLDLRGYIGISLFGRTQIWRPKP